MLTSASASFFFRTFLNHTSTVELQPDHRTRTYFLAPYGNDLDVGHELDELLRVTLLLKAIAAFTQIQPGQRLATLRLKIAQHFGEFQSMQFLLPDHLAGIFFKVHTAI